MVAGEEEPIGFKATERDVGTDPAVPELDMVTAREALPELPAVLVAVAVIWCWPGSREIGWLI
jgi:hypothetical protein